MQSRQILFFVFADDSYFSNIKIDENVLPHKVNEVIKNLEYLYQKETLRKMLEKQ
jgi:hypothetical protein